MNKSKPVGYPISLATEQAIGILSVDDIKISAAGLALLKAREEGKITYEEAVNAVLERARKYGNKT